MQTPPKTLYLVRHAETLWSKEGKHTGRTDIPLTEEGKIQAKNMKPLLEGIAFSKVFSSPSQRAFTTCCLAGFQEKAEILSDLQEWDYGSYEGMTSKEIREINPEWNLFSYGAKEGESIQDIESRADAVIQRMEKESGNILIFSSGHILRVIIARWVGLSAREGRLFFLPPGSLSLLSYEHAKKVLLFPQVEIAEKEKIG